MIQIPDPASSITITKVFDTDATASSAMAGVYTQLINGTYGIANSNYATNVFSDGLTTILAGLSADELQTTTANNALFQLSANNLTAKLADQSYIPTLWASAYSIGIYGANAVLEGIAASTSPDLTDSTRRQLTGEAKCIRAFCHFYLTNFYGDIPLVLTTDFNKTANLARAKQVDVYAQIIKDLKDAQAALPDNYISVGGRVRPNKWAATALLARVYLYTGDYSDASAQAGSVIDHVDLYHLEPDLNNVFLTTSSEAIWQLQQNTSIPNLGNATPEGSFWLPNPLHTGRPPIASLTSQLLNAFEPGDRRRTNWIDSTDYMADPGIPAATYYFPYKYKTGTYNYSVGGAASEYYMVLRLAELYLIRAEAAANGGPGGANAAIADLNSLRHRAGLNSLPANLSASDLTTAIAKEWQTEFFCEWGHRWFNLKRTRQTSAVFSSIAVKQPWKGDYQLLYPLPTQEILNDHYLTQNTGY
ncbi:RagB/SusD family nutrient uptake outer membrane protein [Flavitalea sp. BT771]|uniref:RagB/SusD family nutrient uptake outer membrane protein n=1 Tax=Flavitalea sp. BT771 TaxID=3063329 RepID=UPI0026E119B2|nr:RagB/SusD family nutrient uptake outer membrane protein [Flavitalea sp. BT771]MDO6430072.1 RagB/SusD family nutrient uptake outer membrane protein [Flavitalea sp. BT771]MDV6219789.1 RagB/SusD family nutrient uptake outer membrane protein [Flavitalea sp. BT771]